MTVLFSDVTGSTALAERLDPEALRRLMSRYFEEMRSVITRHGGLVEKFVGDAIMAVFGIPSAHDDDALRAVRASVEMRAALDQLNDEFERAHGARLQVRTGINTGEVMVEEEGAGQTEGLATGEAVNVAARLEQGAAPGEIMLGRLTERLVRNAVRTEPVGPQALRGKQEPVEAFRLIEIDAQAEPYARRLDAEMIGRRRQLRVLATAFDAAVEDRACHLATVVGAPGVGKSRLVREFVQRVSPNVLTLTGRCLPYGTGVTYWPVVELTKQVAGVSDFGDPQAVHDRLAAIVAQDLHADAIVGCMLDVIGLRKVASSTNEVHWAIRRVLESLAAEAPVVVVIEDLHWAEDSMLDLIEHVADWSRDAPLFLLCTTRPELLDERPSWGGGKRSATTLNLEPLSNEDCIGLVSSLLQEPGSARNVGVRIADAADGNPLFVEQIVAMLIDDGILQVGVATSEQDVAEISVPPTIAALLAARLDRLSLEERTLIERAAVIGKTFTRRALVDVVDDGEFDVEALLQAATRRDLLVPDTSSGSADSTFRFRHALIRDAAYGALPKELRAELHERVADGIATRADSRPEERDELLAHHLEQAYRYRAEIGGLRDEDDELARRAADHLAAAAEIAAGRGDFNVSTGLLRRALPLLGTRDPRRAEMLADLGDSLDELGESPEEVWKEALDITEAVGDHRVRAQVRVRQRRYETGDLSEAEAVARDAMAVFEHFGDERGLARAWLLIGTLSFARGRAGDDVDATQRAVWHAGAGSDLVTQADALFQFTRSVVRGPTPVDEGIDRCQVFLQDYAGRRAIEAAMFHGLAHLTARRGDFDVARSHAEQMIAFYRDTGQRFVELYVGGELRADIEMLAGRFDVAAELLLETQLELSEMGDESQLHAAFAAQALCDLDRYGEAEPHAELAADHGGPLFVKALGMGALARVLAAHGEFERAESLARSAVSEIAHTDWLFDRATVSTDLGHVLRAAGQHDAARAAFEEALSFHQRKGDIVSGKRVSTLLG